MTNKNGAVSRALPTAPVDVERAEPINRYFNLITPALGKQLVGNTNKGENTYDQIQRGVTSCHRASERTNRRMSNGH